MGYARKTIDEYQILVNYGQGWEHETTEENWKDCKTQLKCYRENCNYPVSYKKVRVKIN